MRRGVGVGSSIKTNVHFNTFFLHDLGLNRSIVLCIEKMVHFI